MPFPKTPKPLDLAIGGPGWRGWTFAPFGRAADWRITAPTGASFQPCEILEIPQLILDSDALRARIVELEHMARSDALALDARDLAAVTAAVHVLSRALKNAPRVRLCPQQPSVKVIRRPLPVEIQTRSLDRIRRASKSLAEMTSCQLC